MNGKKIKKTLTIALLLLTVAVVGITIAYLQKSSALDNKFQQGKADTVIEEDFDGSVKKDVQIKNEGNLPVYIRCNLSLYYETAKGKEKDNISVTVPQEKNDYELTFAEDFTKNWMEIDGIYYYKKPVEDGKSVPFIKECKELQKKDGEKLVVDISVQSIQAEPERAVSDAWKDVVVNPATKELQAKGVEADESE